MPPLPAVIDVLVNIRRVLRRRDLPEHEPYRQQQECTPSHFASAFLSNRGTPYSFRIFWISVCFLSRSCSSCARSASSPFLTPSEMSNAKGRSVLADGTGTISIGTEW